MKGQPPFLSGYLVSGYLAVGLRTKSIQRGGQNPREFQEEKKISLMDVPKAASCLTFYYVTLNSFIFSGTLN